MRKFRTVVVFLGLLGLSVLIAEVGKTPTAQVNIVPRGFSITAEWLNRRDRLARLELLNRVLYHIKENYVDPKRIDPALMFQEALNRVSQVVPEVRILNPEPTRIVLLVNEARREFSSDLSTLYSLRSSLSDSLKFVREHRQSDLSDKDLELAAIAGVLSTLDPHSVFLTKEVFQETRVGTSGKFGGLGIVIGVRKSKLTVIAPLEGTPAARAGLKARDTITKIGDESTTNMSLIEAVQKMRGPKGVPVTITVMREGWTAGKSYTIVRDIIQIVSVESTLLPEKIGYVRLKNFQGQTSQDLSRHLSQLKKEAGGAIAGLVLDLRNNPGGLLEQAILVTDKFLSAGPIVTTVGFSNTIRDQEKATRIGTEPNYPLVVLVNEGSASASEIVAGALQRRDRAVIMGRQTFGKGTVQSIYNLPEEAGLKLTIAQYLTPGDFSIQTIGITPDVRIIPSIISKDRLDVFRPRRQHGEATLDRHFARPGKLDAEEESQLEIHYLEARSNDERTDDYTVQSGSGSKKERRASLLKDFEIRSAFDLVKTTPSPTNRSALFKAAESLSDTINRAETTKIVSALGQRKIDWSTANGSTKKNCGTPVVEAGLGANFKAAARAGEEVEFAISLSNPGPCTLYQAWARTDSKNYLFHDREFLFGKVAPKETVYRNTKIEIPKSTPTNLARIKIHLYEANGATPKTHDTDIAIRDIEGPRFAFYFSVNDATGKGVKGDGDGIIEVGEQVELRFRVHNTGKAATEEASASIKSPDEKAISFRRGHVPIPKLDPGKDTVLSFLLDARKPAPDRKVDLEFHLSDPVYRIYLTKTFPVTILPKGNLISTKEWAKTRGKRIPILSAPNEEAIPIGHLPAGKIFPVSARVGDFLRAPIEENQFGWILRTHTEDVSAPPKTASLKNTIKWALIESPRVLVNEEKLAFKPTKSQFMRLEGKLADKEAIKDLYIFVNQKKVYYRHFSATLTDGEQPFEAVVPLESGTNRILLVTRNNSDLREKKAFVVFRPGTTAEEKDEIAAGDIPNERIDSFLMDPSEGF